MRWLQRVWEGLRTAYLFIKPLRFAIIPMALLLWALTASAQGQDTVRSLVELDKSDSFRHLALFFSFTTLAALQVWYWSRHLLRTKKVSPTAQVHPGSEKWVPRLLGAGVFVIALLALARAAYFAWSGSFDYTTGVILTSCGILVLLLVVFLVGVAYRRTKLGAIEPAETYRDLDFTTKVILLGTVIVGAIFVVGTAAWPLSVGSLFRSPALLMVSTLLWVGLGSFVAYAFDSYRVPLIATFLIVAIAFSFINDNHTVRTLDGAPPGRPTIDAAFSDWYARLSAKYPDGPTPVFLVATEGGGIRAAYWTAAVLTAIQDRAPQLSDHLFAISGVSGGSLGGAVFTALVADDPCRAAGHPCAAETRHDAYRSAAQQILSYDFLAPTLASMLHADFVQRFLPWGFIPDRGRALETGWEEAWRSALPPRSGHADLFAGGMLKMYAERKSELLPSLFLNATSVESGSRIIASNCDVARGQIPNATDLFAELNRDMRLSTATHNSARFTYVSPAGSIRASKSLLGHVVDGGYFEDSGTATAADLITHLQPILEQAHRPYSIHLILVKFESIDPGRGDPAPRPERFMNEVLSPLRALLATRDARATLSYAEAGRLSGVITHQFILTENLRGLRMPTGWLLSKRTRNAMDLQIGEPIDPGHPRSLDPALLPAVEKNLTEYRRVVQLLNPAAARTAVTPDTVLKDAADHEAADKN
jgi:hypothetical protein